MKTLMSPHHSASAHLDRFSSALVAYAHNHPQPTAGLPLKYSYAISQKLLGNCTFLLRIWMVNCHQARGKRRRSGPSEDKRSLKKLRYEDIEPCTTKSTEVAAAQTDAPKRKRVRKRTKALRELIKNKIEVALRKSSAPLSRLFTSRDDGGTPQAPYVEVIKEIGLSHEDWLKAASLSPAAVESISNITNMFRLERNSDNKLMLKYRAAEWSVDECTVYLDNLPIGCTSEKIRRIARKFGSVVEVRLPRSSSRPVACPQGTMELGRHPLSFAFVQFTEPDACKSICEAFAHNVPTTEKKEKCQALVPLLQRLLSQIRTLSRRRRRRTYAQNVMLMKLRRQQAAIIKMERTAHKRTTRISRMIERDKAHTGTDRLNGKPAQENDIDGDHSTSLNTSLDTSLNESGENRRVSFGKKKKPKMLRSLPDKPLPPRKKRKRRRHRKHGVGPHTIVGSLNDYFARMQVFSYSHYMELRKEYLALRRQSQTQTNQLSRENFRFEGFRTFGGKLRHKLESYRDRFWDADHVEEE